MSRVVHFEIHATAPARLMAFYESLFGWHFERFMPEVEYWSIITGPEDQLGINGGLMQRRGPSPLAEQAVNACICTVQVASVDEALAKNAELGGTVALPKMPIPGVGWLAYIKDLDGNIIGLMSPDPTATV